MPNEETPPPARPTIWQLLISPYTLIGVIGLVAVGFMFIAIVKGTLLGSLQNIDIARGLITFLVAITTIVIALVLSLYPLMTSEQGFKERFGLGKEVLTTLIGVLGTIVGFYFGSGERLSALPELAAIKVAGTQVLAHASGGVKPYRYRIVTSDKDIKEISDISSDGWIIVSLPRPPAAGTEIRVEVVDGRDQKVDQKTVVEEPAGQGKPETSPGEPSPAKKPDSM